MNKLARILLVEPEPDLRRDLDQHLEHAGHEVAAVPDSEAARSLVQEGLLPDVVVADAARPDEEVALREILPHAAHLRIVRDRDAGDTDTCSSDPAEILRRIEEMLVNHAPYSGHDDASRCMDLARRLANSLPKTRTAEERIGLLTEGFDAFFRVRGTLVVRRGLAGEWIEVRQGLAVDLADRISGEIARRTQHRGLRPFFTRLLTTDGVQQVACLPVEVGGQETDLAMALETAPDAPAHRESLMNLIGGAMRTAMNEEAAEDVRDLLDAQQSSFQGLLAMSREFAGVSSRRSLGAALLSALQQELHVTRSALFVPRPDGRGMLELHATQGFPRGRLDKIGLSAFHGVAAECLQSDCARRLSTFAITGAAARELSLLGEVNLRWAAPFHRDGETPGVLLFDSPEDGEDLSPAARQILSALLEAASIALEGLGRLEAVQDLSTRTLQGLVAAIELWCPKDRGHAERVTRHAVRLGRAMSMTAAELRDLAFAAMLHDVGKIAPVDPGSADAGRAHPVMGSRILSRAKPVAAVIQAVEQHHERWDGHGFPYGLRQDGIQLFARVLSIANAYAHDLTVDESPAARDDALRRLERGAALLWDPVLVALFVAEVESGASSDFRLDGEGWLEDVLAAP